MAGFTTKPFCSNWKECVRWAPLNGLQSRSRDGDVNVESLTAGTKKPAISVGKLWLPTGLTQAWLKRLAMSYDSDKLHGSNDEKMTDNSVYIQRLLEANSLREPVLRSAIQTLQFPRGSHGLDVSLGHSISPHKKACHSKQKHYN